MPSQSLQSHKEDRKQSKSKCTVCQRMVILCSATKKATTTTSPCTSTKEVLAATTVQQQDPGQPKKNAFEGIPGSPVVRTLHFHCQGPGFDP